LHIARVRKYYEEKVSHTLRFTIWHFEALDHLMRIFSRGQRILDAGLRALRCIALFSGMYYG
jgi:hypothetical protein